MHDPYNPYTYLAKKPRKPIQFCKACSQPYLGKLTVQTYCKPCKPSISKAQIAAVITVRKARLAGDLPPPNKLKCVDCGKPAYCYDHRDYSKPLQVDAVCASCNKYRGAAKTEASEVVLDDGFI